MRGERLLRLLLLLQSSGRLTAAQAAETLEVSLPTARRDLEALAAAGVPVYSTPGRGGGWQLVGGARTDLTGLTEPETLSLFGLLGPASAGNPEATRALSKLLLAVPRPFRDHARTAWAATVVDSVGWGQQPTAEPASVATLRSAVIGRREVELTYLPRSGPRQRRRLHPLGVVAKAGQWYLLAATPAGLRTFRADRVAEVRQTAATFEPPEGFDLSTVWAEVADRVERLRTPVPATVRVAARHVDVILTQFAGEVVVAGDPATLVIRAHLARGLAEQLAGWGNAVEVVTPPEVRAELARIGAELLGRYAPGGLPA